MSMKQLTLFALCAALTASATFADNKNLRGEEESRHAATLEQEAAHVSKRANNSALLHLPELSSELKNLGFATCKTAFIFAGNKGASLRIYNALQDDAVTVKMSKSEDLLSLYKKTPSRIDRIFGSDEYNVDAVQAPIPTYAVIKYEKKSRSDDTKTKHLFHGARQGLGDAIARTLSISRANNAYAAETISGVYLNATPTMIVADSAEQLEDVLGQLKAELFELGVDVNLRDERLKPILTIVVNDDLLLESISQETWGAVKAHYNVTSLIDSEIRQYFMKSREALIGVLEKKIENEVNQNLTEEVFGDVETILNQFNLRKFVRASSKYLFSDKAIGTAFAIVIIGAYFGNFGKWMQEKMPGTSFFPWNPKAKTDTDTAKTAPTPPVAPAVSGNKS